VRTQVAASRVRTPDAKLAQVDFKSAFNTPLRSELIPAAVAANGGALISDPMAVPSSAITLTGWEPSTHASILHLKSAALLLKVCSRAIVRGSVSGGSRELLRNLWPHWQ
jgi:hypothetical protein